MKDAYSFDASLEQLNQSYEKMYAAYCRIFNRCGLDYLAVEAESGPIGGDASHEFMVPAENGEDVVLHCPDCGYAANQERAEIGSRDLVPPNIPLNPLEKVATPGASTIEQVSKFLGCQPQQTHQDAHLSGRRKTDRRAGARRPRGQRGKNPPHRRGRQDRAGRSGHHPASDRGAGGLLRSGGHGENIPIFADRNVEQIRNGVTGANAADMHLTGVNPGRDFQPRCFADLRNAVHGDPCPRCSSKLELRQAIEVGHVFKLGTKYSDALQARFLDQNEQMHPIIMGCYGIGINRIIAGLIETSHDSDGIIWPLSLAPYEVLLAPVKVTDPASREAADALYAQLSAAGVEVLLDDRNVRAGVKFKDADLLGIPLRVVIGDRGLKEGKLETKWRWDKKAELIDLDGAAETIIKLITEERASGQRFRGR